MTNDNDVQEREANLFAMNLLMPERFVRDEVRKLGGIDLCDEKKMKKLADKFKVPLTIMAVRIGQLSEDTRA